MAQLPKPSGCSWWQTAQPAHRWLQCGCSGKDAAQARLRLAGVLGHHLRRELAALCERCRARAAPLRPTAVQHRGATSLQHRTVVWQR